MKSTAISILIASVLVAVAIVFSNNGGSANENSVANNVSVIDGVQIIEISAKGGYLPRKSTAKSGIPTILRFDTSGTFDCSSSVRIPSMNISKALPQTGSTDIDIGNQEVATLQGTCGMGMYPFEIDFQS
ncbi:MAG: cupredoxin domain-containing protein [Patescibacteria group bacterium]